MRENFLRDSGGIYMWMAMPATMTSPMQRFADAGRTFAGRPMKALKGLPPKQRKTGCKSQEMLDRINRLFDIERQLSACTPEKRLEARNLKSRPLVEALRKWLDEIAPSVLPKSLFGLAVNYGRQQWPKLARFLEDGRIDISKNRAERSIKPFVIGRKNWLFANTPKGARASAVIYSIIESAKENRLNPYAYLNYLFEKLPNLDSRDDVTLDALLSWSINLQ